MISHLLNLIPFPFEVNETFPLEQLTGPLHEREYPLNLELELEQIPAQQVEWVARKRELGHDWAWEGGVRSHQRIRHQSQILHVAMGQV